MQQTSLMAYKMAQKHLNKSQRTILTLWEGGCGELTNAEIGQRLGWPINRVTPRVLELRRMNPPKLRDCGIRKCNVTNNTAHQWGLN